MPEADPHVTSPKFIALPRFTPNGRAQLRVLNMPHTMNKGYPTMEQWLTVCSSHNPFTNDVTISDIPQTRLLCTPREAYQICPPDAVPEERIPPKPPYLIGPITSWPQTERDSRLKQKAWLGMCKKRSIPHKPTPASVQLLYGNQKPQPNF